MIFTDMRFEIKNKVIDADILDIIYKIKRDSRTNLLRQVLPSKSEIKVSCPFHSEGMEKHPSCYIHRSYEDETQPGTGHCFACGVSFSLSELVEECFQQPKGFGDYWLLDNFSAGFVSDVQYLPSINIDCRSAHKFMDENELEKYRYYHDYMWKRKLSKEIIDRFDIGYDPEKQMVTFPVRDRKGNLLFITKRSVKTKFFSIPKDTEKPLYLLDEIIKTRVSKAAICEGQIDALTCWTYGLPAVATMGQISEHQIEELKKSGLRVIISLFDNDSQGYKMHCRLKDSLSSEILLIRPKFPLGKKDVNDMTKEEFDEMMA